MTDAKKENEMKSKQERGGNGILDFSIFPLHISKNRFWEEKGPGSRNKIFAGFRGGIDAAATWPGKANPSFHTEASILFFAFLRFLRSLSSMDGWMGDVNVM